MIYHTKVKSSAVFLHDASLIPPFPLLFFGGNIAVGKDGPQDTITVDGWIVFQASPQIAELVKVSGRKETSWLRLLGIYFGAGPPPE